MRVNKEQPVISELKSAGETQGHELGKALAFLRVAVAANP